ncbi:receptor kinase-like protein Xa21 [Tripterygium wilfordii]|uniref:receptor kinase-like protein Xa21 n=1 Tax=Tripterygium wilfordii TaxID=458696 RepID=UPI0018F842FD|nr:receptor kinase-like protein Xa21 [Tripterygium wilfordii]
MLNTCSIVFCLFLLGREKVGKKASATLLQIEEHFPMISYAELRHATNDISPSYLIGEGSYGSVNKGILDGEDGMIQSKMGSCSLSLAWPFSSNFEGEFFSSCDVLVTEAAWFA